MSHYRQLYRNAIEDAVTGSVELSDFTRLRAWDEEIDFETLPVWGVFADAEQSALSTQKGVKRRATDLSIVAKIAGDDTIEEELDALADLLEALVEGALHAKVIGGAQVSCVLQSLSISIASGNAQRVGTVALKFTVAGER